MTVSVEGDRWDLLLATGFRKVVVGSFLILLSSMLIVKVVEYRIIPLISLK